MSENNLEKIKISVIIPIGPTGEESKKIMDKSIPKPLLELGGSGGMTLLWHVLKQLESITANIETIYLIANPEIKELVESQLELYQELDDALLKKVKIETEGDSIPKKISVLKIKTPYFMFHNPDIILRNESAQSLYKGLMRTHHNGANDEYPVTFVTSRKKYCKGACELQILGIIDDRIGLMEKETVSHSAEEEMLPANVAISMFNTSFLELLKGHDGNVFYKEIQNVLSKNKIKWMEHCYEGDWYHADNHQAILDYKPKVLKK